eukprot:CAMPEP_0170772038 /NCGR_PEP_ID=MMETSP0733-20121128/8424_1 /TAXON_ID=186038 /ORGANISM="Fragilariopsis kerguelensis, Strain L26-C5" /LENGTH=41 /DNA_ID= /DNA_START= /DNA_END= /DNA_ORIENTATION=
MAPAAEPYRNAAGKSWNDLENKLLPVDTADDKNNDIMMVFP